jgi:hypothetical protein
MKIIEYLKSFNRKERFHLVGQLLGNCDFTLDPNIFGKLLVLMNLETPSYYYSAMDYHLDWIYASVVLASDNAIFPKERDNLCITATQEDVDFLIAFVDDTDVTHLIMIEAKGDTSFTNKQIESKANRLKAIFGDDGFKWDKVQPHFVLCSPARPQLLNLDSIPAFMLNAKRDGFRWFRLYMPANQRKVTRCKENGKASKNGTYWKVDGIRLLDS